MYIVPSVTTTTSKNPKARGLELSNSLCWQQVWHSKLTMKTQQYLAYITMSHRPTQNSLNDQSYIFQVLLEICLCSCKQHCGKKIWDVISISAPYVDSGFCRHQAIQVSFHFCFDQQNFRCSVQNLNPHRVL